MDLPRPLLALSLLALLCAGCAGPAQTQTSDAVAEKSGTAMAAWHNETVKGTAMAIVDGSGFVEDPREQGGPAAFLVADGTTVLQVELNTTGSKGASLTLYEPGCSADPTKPMTPSPCAHARDSPSGTPAIEVQHPKPGQWTLQVDPSTASPPGPWQADYVATVSTTNG